jgi:hypothetical protein
MRSHGRIRASQPLWSRTYGLTLLSAQLGLYTQRFNDIVRTHWSIENRLHWVPDVIMNEDQTRNRKDQGPNNLALLCKLALNLAKLEPSKGSMRGKLKRAGWDYEFL